MVGKYKLSKIFPHGFLKNLKIILLFAAKLLGMDQLDLRQPRSGYPDLRLPRLLQLLT